jgi:DNA helicase-2/ATP-dependent DNA helicase PcrA
MQDLTDRLRAGEGVTVDTGAASETDVVLASHWEPLWAASDLVLPFSFGQIGNRIDAAIGLLLRRVVTSHFGELSSFGPEAALILDLEPDVVRVEAATVFNPVLERLSGGTATDAEGALALLRRTLLDMESKTIPKLAPPKEAERVERLRRLAQRIGNADLVPGMTVHQAKGREWTNVGAHLTRGQQARVAAGLSQANETDRLLYVALTRAKRTVRLV